MRAAPIGSAGIGKEELAKFPKRLESFPRRERPEAEVDLHQAADSGTFGLEPEFFGSEFGFVWRRAGCN